MGIGGIENWNYHSLVDCFLLLLQVHQLYLLPLLRQLELNLDGLAGCVFGRLATHAGAFGCEVCVFEAALEPCGLSVL